MRDENDGKTGTEPAKSELGLGRCLVDGDAETSWRGRLSRRKTFGVSLGVEVLLLGLLVAAPLLSSVAEPQLHQILPPPIAFFGGWHAHNPQQHVITPATFHKPEIPSPVQENPATGVTVHALSAEEPADAAPDLPGGYIPGGIQVTQIERMPPPIEPPRVEQPAHQEKRPLKLSEGVVQAQLIARIEPRYPPLALQMRQSGTVVLHAIISRDGHISALEVVSGSPFFVQAALDAVRQWRYRPTLLNGEPVEVETTITVEFRLQH